MPTRTITIDGEEVRQRTVPVPQEHGIIIITEVGTPPNLFELRHFYGWGKRVQQTSPGVFEEIIPTQAQIDHGINKGNAFFDNMTEEKIREYVAAAKAQGPVPPPGNGNGSQGK